MSLRFQDTEAAAAARAHMDGSKAVNATLRDAGSLGLASGIRLNVEGAQGSGLTNFAQQVAMAKEPAATR